MITDSSASFAEERTDGLSQGKDVSRSYWTINEIFVHNRTIKSSNLSTVPYENGTEAPDGSLLGTSSESYLKDITNIYNNLPASLDKQSEISTDQMSEQPTGQMMSTWTRDEVNYSGDSTRASLRRTRDRSTVEHQMKTSKQGSSRNLDDTTTDNSSIISSGQSVNKPFHGDDELPHIRMISDLTENASITQGGQLITISVENSPRTPTTSAGKTAESSVTFFRTTARLSSIETGTLKNSPVGE